MKQCPQCHRVYGHEVSYCLEDGTLLTGTQESDLYDLGTLNLSASDNKTSRKKNPAIKFLVLIPAAALLIILGIVISKNSTPPKRTVTKLQEVDPHPPDDSADAHRIIEPETFEIEPTGWKAFPFNVGGNGGRLVGEFAARGGITDNIRAIVLAEDELDKYKTSYPYRSFFDSGKIYGVGSINIDLPPGSYYIIISNPSPVFSRRVRAPISLEIY